MTQTIYASVLWQSFGNLILKGSGADANPAGAAMKARLWNIVGSSSGDVYGPAVLYGMPVFLGITIDNVAGDMETVTIAVNLDLSDPNWSAAGTWSVSGKDIRIPTLVAVKTMEDKASLQGFR